MEEDKPLILDGSIRVEVVKIKGNQLVKVAAVALATLVVAGLITYSLLIGVFELEGLVKRLGEIGAR